LGEEDAGSHRQVKSCTPLGFLTYSCISTAMIDYNAQRLLELTQKQKKANIFSWNSTNTIFSHLMVLYAHLLVRYELLCPVTRARGIETQRFCRPRKRIGEKKICRGWSKFLWNTSYARAATSRPGMLASWLLGRRRGRREGGVWEEEEAKHVDLYSLADLEVPFRFHLCVVYGLIQIR
jgi:hypothetical protein